MRPDRPDAITRRDVLRVTASAGSAAVLSGPSFAAASFKTPGVYIKERDAFGNAIVPVETAVPAFIGYTEKAETGGKSLRNVPMRLGSLADFQAFFGGAATPMFDLVKAVLPRPPGGFLASGGGALKDPGPPVSFELRTAAGAVVLDLKRVSPAYLLHTAMLFFFANGGGNCIVVSVGSYGEEIARDRLLAGLVALEKEPEPTMVVIPEAVRLSRQDAMAMSGAMLTHCGVTMKNRVAILDLFGGWCDRSSAEGDPVQAFRDEIGVEGLSYGAAYYPWLNTTVRQPTEFSFANLTHAARGALVELVLENQKTLFPEKIRERVIAEVRKIATFLDARAATEDAVVTRARTLLDQTLRVVWPAYGEMMQAIASAENPVPPASAMAGIYTRVDNASGVWKSPANESVNSALGPAVAVTDAAQADLNVSTVDGKSINAIRAFPGRGVVVWGARTLAGNSQDFRYVGVRRTLIMLEQSIRLGVRAYVFEANDATTWASIRSTVENFLTGIWQQGGLLGATPADAFAVNVGLGTTMTPQDILDGILRVSVLVATLRPAEFVVIAIEQKMQGG